MNGKIKPISGASVRDNLSDAIRLWEYAVISLIDVRHHLILPEKALIRYRTPASTLIYTNGGRAEVSIDSASYKVDRFGIFHGGEGTELSIIPENGWLEYYMIQYNASEPPHNKREYQRLIANMNPFMQQYGFAPENPLFISELVRKMFEVWKNPTPLERFYEKSAFYQLVYEVYKNIYSGTANIFQPDIITIAKRYMDEHYHEAISIQWLASVLGISDSNLRRSFNKKYGKSPQDYLIHQRLSAVKKQLAATDCTIREIALSCGFSDELALMRMFKRNFHMTAGEYRAMNTVGLRDYAIENTRSFLYNNISRVSNGKPKREGATDMIKFMRSKVFFAAAFSVMLLLSACGTTEDASRADTTAAQISAEAVTTAEHTEGETKMIRTVMGDVEVPANPQRVVVNGWWVGDVIAFGVTPVAIQSLYARGNGYASKTDGVKILDKWEAEDIMAESPDLIITGYERNYDDLSKIAPTILIPYDTPDEERLPLIAQALGKEAYEGTVLLEAFNQRVAEAKERLKKAGVMDMTITVCRNGTDSGLEIQWANWWGGAIVYDALEMPMPDTLKAIKTKDSSMFTNVFSFEILSQYIGDYILMCNTGESANEALQENAVWNSIPAVKNGNIIEIDAAVLFFNDITSQNIQLDLITEALLGLSSK